MDSSVLHLGGDEAEFLSVTVLGRSHGDATDYWDGNWLAVEVQLAIGGFRGGFSATFRAEEFRSFLLELRQFATDVSASANFQTLENQLELHFTGDGRGHIAVSGLARDVAGTGNQLRFQLGIDQTQASALTKQTDALVARYPVIGSPAA